MTRSLVQCFVIFWVVLTSTAIISLIAFGIMTGQHGQSHTLFLIPLTVWIIITIMVSMAGAVSSLTSLVGSDSENETDENENYELDRMACGPTIGEQIV